MAQVKLIKINSDGFSEEHGASDDATFATVTGVTQVGVTNGVTITDNIVFDDVADTIAGIQSQNLLDKTAAETLSNTWTVATGSKLILTDAPTLATHATNKDYVDSLALTNKRKDAVVVATTADITLSGEQTIDGILTSTSRVLVKDQSTASENGIYVSAAGAWARSADADTGSEILAAITKVLQGTQADSNFQNTNSTEPTIGVTAITFTDLGSSTSHNALAGLQGGNGSTEYFHMTSDEDTWIGAAETKISTGGNVVGNDINDTITATWTVTGEFDIAGGDLVVPNAVMSSPEEGSMYWDGTSDQLFVYDGTSYVDVSSSGTASSVQTVYTAGAGGIAQYDLVYQSANDTVLKADANAFATSKIIGFAPIAITAAASGSIQEDGVLAGVLSGAAFGTAYFLSETPGEISTARPTTSGAFVTLVGYAKNATDLHIQIQQIGRRA